MYTYYFTTKINTNSMQIVSVFLLFYFSFPISRAKLNILLSIDSYYLLVICSFFSILVFSSYEWLKSEVSRRKSTVIIWIRSDINNNSNKKFNINTIIRSDHKTNISRSEKNNSRANLDQFLVDYQLLISFKKVNYMFYTRKSKKILIKRLHLLLCFYVTVT